MSRHPHSAAVRLRACIVVLTVMLGASSSARAQGRLFAYDAPSWTTFFEHSPGGEAWGDIDGDGDVDAVFAGGVGVRLLINDGTGRLSVAPNGIPKYPWIDGFFAHGVALADLDYDADLDLVAAVVSSQNKPAVRFWENDGKGKFTISKRFSVGSLSKGVSTRALAVGDLDGDGDNDIVVSGYRFLWNNGFGVFTEKNPIPKRSNYNSEVIRLVDFDKDGRLDIFFGIGFSELWLNDRKGGYKRSWFTAAYWVKDARFADLDRDGDLDLVLNNDYYSRASLEIILNTPTGLVPSQRFGNYGGAPPFSIGDVDGDGDVDVLAVIDQQFFMNDGKAKFVKTPNMMDAPNWPKGQGHVYGSILQDLDGDGDLDVGGLYRTAKSAIYSAIVFRNRQRHLLTPDIVALGKPLAVTMIADNQHTQHLGISLGEPRIPMGAWGDLRIDPAAMVRLPGHLLRNRVPGAWTFTVPNNPILSGLTLRFQALDVAPNNGPGTHFTNLMRTVLK